MATKDNLAIQRNAFKASLAPSAIIAKQKKLPVFGPNLKKKPKTSIPTSGGLNQIGGDFPTSGGLNQIGASATSRVTSKVTPKPIVPTSGGLNQIGAEAPQDGSWIGDGRVAPKAQPTGAATPTQPTSTATTPTAPATTTPAPATPAPTAQTGTGTATPTTGATAPTTGTPGFNESELLRLGVSQDQIDRMKQIAGPMLQAGAASSERAGDLYGQTTKQLTAEQLELEKFQQDIANRKKSLTDESLALVDEAAGLQTARAKEEYQANQFRNEQGKKEFELSQSRAERELETANIENETRLRRAMAAQVGVSYGSQGLEMMGRLMLDGNTTLADLRTKTSLGMAEFSFKAMDIESNYTNSINEIITNSKTEKLGLKSNLDDDLDEIDSQILASKQEKQALAREALKDYMTKVDEVETRNAELISSSNQRLFEEKKELEQEKLERETFDPGMSSELGFFANRYGQPVGVPEGAAPKPYAGGWDEGLSKQFGHLVDGRGRAILGADGNQIKYSDPAVSAYSNSLDAYANGDYNLSDLGNLNFAMGSNSAIAGALENGKVYGSPKYGKLQCGEYINDQFLASRQLGSDYANADKLIKESGGKPGSFQPNVGDVVFMNTGDPKIPHKAIVEGMKEDGTLILTDANYTAPGQVRHGWEIPVGSKDYKKIYGFARLPLKPNVAAATPVMSESNGTDGGAAVNRLLDIQLGSPEAYHKLSQKDKTEIISSFGVDTIQSWLQSKSGGEDASSSYRDDPEVNWVDTVLENKYGDKRAALAKEKQEKFYNLMGEGRTKEAMSIATEGLFKNNKDKDEVLSARMLVNNYKEVDSALKELEALAKKEGVDVQGPYAGRYDKIMGSLGQKRPEEATRLRARLGKAFAEYGKSISGAAMSDSERAKLMEQFGAMEKAPFNNRVLVEELLRGAQSTLDQRIEAGTNGMFSSADELNQALASIERYGQAPPSAGEMLQPFASTAKPFVDFAKNLYSSSPKTTTTGSVDLSKYVTK